MSKLEEKKKAMSDQMARDEIYRAAIEVLEENGFKGMTMDRVAEAAEVAKGTLYNYFKNKEELLDFTHDKLFDDHWTEMEQILSQALSPLEKLRAAVWTVFQHFSTNRKVLIAIHDNHCHPPLAPKPGSSRRERPREFFRGLVADATRLGQLRLVDPDFAAETLIGGIMASVRSSESDGRGLDPELFTDRLLDIFLNGVKAKTP